MCFPKKTEPDRLLHSIYCQSLISSTWHILMTVVACFMLTTLELYLAPVPAGVHTHTHIQIHTDTHTHTHGQCLLPCLSKCPGAETPKIFLTKLVKPGLVLEYSHLGDKALALGSLLQIFSDMWKLSQGCIKAKIDRKTDFLLPFPAILLRSPELEKYGEKSNTLFSESG